jgi:lysozyme
MYPTGITQAMAETILGRDLAIAESAGERLVKVPLTQGQGQFDALVDFVFSLGAGRLASSLLATSTPGEFDEAAWQLLAWDHTPARGRLLP